MARPLPEPYIAPQNITQHVTVVQASQAGHYSFSVLGGWLLSLLLLPLWPIIIPIGIFVWIVSLFRKPSAPVSFRIID